MGFSSQSGHIAFRTQASPALFPTDFATAAIAMKLKTGALAANRDLLIPDPEIGGGRDVNDAFLGAVTYTGDYEFYVRLQGIMTLLYSCLGIHVVGPAGTNDVQTLGHTGTITGGTFTLTYGAQTTAAIPFNATPGQVQSALAALSNIGDNDVVVTQTAAGNLSSTTYAITFDGTLNGTVTAVTATSTNLVGSTPIITVTHTTTGLSNVAGFQHLFIPSDAAQLPFLGIEEQVSNLFDVYQYTDGVVNTLHFECDANGYLMGTAGMIARIQNAQTSPIDVSNLTDSGDLLVGTNITVTFGGTTLAAKSFKFDLDNQIAADDFRLGSFVVGDLTPKRRMCTVGVTIREQDKTLGRQATYGSSAATSPGGVITKQNLTITASTYSTMPGSSPVLAYSISIIIPLAALKPYALKVSGDDIMDDDITFQALRPVLTTPLVKIKVVNMQSGAPA
jgi:hypothetical protein